MPTFTAIAFDRLIEPGAAKSMVQARNSPDSKLERRRSTSNTTEIRAMDAPSSMVEKGYGIPPNPKPERGVNVPPNPKLDRGVNVPPNLKLERGVSVPPSTKLEGGVGVHPNSRGVSVPPNAKLERGVAMPSHAPTTTVVDKEHHWTQISPALYATPESTPLPDSPSSFPPSPYIINHKRRGPRLMKSFSEYDVANWKNESDEIKVDENESSAEKGIPSEYKDDISVPTEVMNPTTDNNASPSGTGDAMEKNSTGVCNGKHGSSKTPSSPVGQNGETKSVNFSLQQDGVVGSPVDAQDSVSLKAIGENEGSCGAERSSLSQSTPITEFYDAWEELSSESGHQHPLPDIEAELREMKLTLLMEIENRKQAEENLNNLRSQWQRIHEQSSLVGLNLPADPTAVGEGEEPADLAAEICQQVYLARFVSNSIGRGVAKAEVEMEMEAQIELKNTEIARLWDRLHYFEAVNQEMSHRNQEVVETARRLRQRRKRQRWIWGSISAALTLGSGVLLYSYLHGGKGSSSQSSAQASETDRGSNK